MEWRLRRIIFRLAERSLRALLGRLRRKRTDRTGDCAGYLVHSLGLVLDVLEHRTA